MQKSSDALVAQIESQIVPLLAEMGIELVEAQFRMESQRWVLRLFIDKEGGVTVDDCATVSRRVDHWLEEEDLIPHAFVLEVSSPGLERPLKRPQDFVRFAGRRARIKLREDAGRGKVLLGVLEGMDGDQVRLNVDNELITARLEEISKARLTLD